MDHLASNGRRAPRRRKQHRAGKAPLAVYANYCEIGHNAFEFLIDFGQFRPEKAAVQLHSRIVSGPVQAKLFGRLLMNAIERYEADYGPIADLNDDDAFESLLASVPGFERRAINARGKGQRIGLTASDADGPDHPHRKPDPPKKR